MRGETSADLTSSQSNPDGRTRCIEAEPGVYLGIIRRIKWGLGASAFVPMATIAIQLVTVPLMLHAWGAQKYGEWLILSAVPSYLALSDLGFGNASGSDMTYRAARGDRVGALATFQSSWFTLTLVSAIALLLACPTLWLLPWSYNNVGSLRRGEAQSVVLVLAAFSLIAQQNSIFESGFRCEGNFASGTFWITIQRVVETFLATAVAVMGGGFLGVATTFFVTRLVGTVLYARLLFEKSPWLSVGTKYVKIEVIKQLSRPALGFVIFPLAQAMSLQGFTLLIGSLDGPITVTMFTTGRTFTRLNFQVVNTIGRTLWPELSSAFARGDLPLARSLHRIAFQATASLASTAAIVMWVTGPTFYRLWVKAQVQLDSNCFHILILVTIAYSVWNASSIVPMSTNLHGRIAWTFLWVTCLSLILAFEIVPRVGVSGAAMSLLIADLVMCWVVLREASKQLGDTHRKLLTIDRHFINAAIKLLYPLHIVVRLWQYRWRGPGSHTR